MSDKVTFKKLPQSFPEMAVTNLSFKYSCDIKLTAKQAIFYALKF